MINKEKFKEAITTLETYFDKKIQPQSALAVWFKYLGQNLTDEELDGAVEQAIIKCRPHPSFMPTPEELVGFINGGKEAKAMTEWQSVLKAAARQDEESCAYLSARGRIALQAIGGLRAVGLAEERARERMERNFVSVFCQCPDKDAFMLPPSSVVELEQTQDHESVPIPDYVKQQMKSLKQKISMNGAGRNE